MALNYDAILNTPAEIDGARAFIAVNYGGGNQTVASAVAAQTPTTNAQARSITFARGILVTTAGNFEVLTVGRTDAVTVALPAGWNPMLVTQVNQAGSTGAGFYYF